MFFKQHAALRHFLYILLALACAPTAAFAEDGGVVSGFQSGFEHVVGIMSDVLFYNVLGFPFVVLWLIIGGVYCTLRLCFVNLRLFKHGFDVALGKYSRADDPGEVTPFAAFASAVSGTVGLGNIAGVAVAVAMGGPGAVIWMMVAGFLGMSTKFAEVTLGHKYRKIDENGKVTGGAFYYLRDGLAELGKPGIGKVLAVLFAILCLGGAVGGGNMFQSNQAVAIASEHFSFFADADQLLAIGFAVMVGVVLLGGVTRIAHVAEAIVPMMAMVYLLAGVSILFVNAENIIPAIGIMFSDAFTGGAVGGGIMGAMVAGFRRAVFSNEAGVGSSPIVMAATKSREPVQVGAVAIVEPVMDTMIICFMTGLMITCSGVYIDAGEELTGVLMTANAFATVADWFPKVLAVCVMLFAFSTMITWSYYGSRAWHYLFGEKTIKLYYLIFCTATFFGGAMQDAANEGFKLIVDFSDLSLLSMAIPNLLGVYFLSSILIKEMKSYEARLKAGEIKMVPKEERNK